MSLAAFAGQAWANFQKTAAVVPSSRFLAEAMVEPLPLRAAKVVVELGPGTGVMTRELLQLVPDDCHVLAFEINPQFVEYLRNEVQDPRLEVVASGAENAAAELRRRGYTSVDAVLSSLGFGTMPEAFSHQVIRGLRPFLDRRSGLTQFQYVQSIRWHDGGVEFFDMRAVLGQYFSHVERRKVWRNLPPANVLHFRV